MRYIFILVILGFIFNTAVANDETDLPANKPDSNISVNAINTAKDAVELALKYTGFDKSKEFKRPERASDICQIITTKDSTTAFLSDELSNRIAWQVKLQNVSLHLKGNTPDGRILGPVDFIVIIDSLTWIPLRINSVSTVPPDREPVSAVAEAQLSSLREKYIGLPQQYPLMTVTEALNQCKFYPALAKEIIINYVLYSKDDSQPQPAWVIYLRGLPPKSSSYPRPDLDYTTTNTRYVFSAINKILLEHNNLPYPLLSNDK